MLKSGLHTLKSGQRNIGEFVQMCLEIWIRQHGSRQGNIVRQEVWCKVLTLILG